MPAPHSRGSVGGGHEPLGKPRHVDRPGPWVLQTGQHRGICALKGLDEHQGEGVVVELGTLDPGDPHPETQGGENGVESRIKLTVGSDQSRVVRPKPECSDGWRVRWGAVIGGKVSEVVWRVR